MKTIWTLIALSAAAALFVIYRSNQSEPPLEVVSNCQDSYPAVVTRQVSTNGAVQFSMSCKPDRFIRAHVPERSL